METQKLQIPPKILMPDRTQNQFNDSLMQFLRVLAAHPLLQGTFLQNISLVVGDNVIRHNLNYPVRGWFVVNCDSQNIINTSLTENPDAKNTLILDASNDGIATIYIF